MGKTGAGEMSKHIMDHIAGTYLNQANKEAISWTFDADMRPFSENW